MSTITLASLEYISREDLASALTSNPIASNSPDSKIAIIDVRDSDHIGGHIRGSTWVPSSELDYRVPELVRTLKDKETVVFHCALSQQRGPSAALRYLREKKRLEPEAKVVSEGEVKEGGAGGDAERAVDGADAGEKGQRETEKKGEQKVLVLRGGFTEWQEKYGEDERLTEGYQKDIWAFGMY